MPLTVVRHPLVDDALARLRDRATPCDEFRRLAHRVSVLLAVEATRDLPTAASEVETPLERTRGAAHRHARGGGARAARRASACWTRSWSCVPQAQVGYFGLERNEQTAVARRYYEKVPKDLGDARRLPARPDARHGRLRGDGGRRPARAGRARACACSRSWPLPRASRTSSRRCRTRTSSRPRSTARSTIASTSCPASATSATACSAPSGGRSREG